MSYKMGDGGKYCEVADAADVDAAALLVDIDGAVVIVVVSSID